MKLKLSIGVLLIASILLSGHTQAFSATQSTALHQWLVQPKACIVQELGDTCELNLNINIPPLAEGKYCYFLQNVKLTCFMHDRPVVTLQVTLENDTLLELRRELPTELVANRAVKRSENNAQTESDNDTDNTQQNASTQNVKHEILYSQILEIKTRKSNANVRRVRDPWSLF